MISKENLIKLKADLTELNMLSLELSSKKEKFELENKTTSDKITTLKTSIEATKVILTEEAKKEFEKTKLKKLTGGLGIRESTNISYDETKALKWAKEKDLFLILDKKGFEKSAISLKLDFVKESKVTSVTFPKEITI